MDKETGEQLEERVASLLAQAVADPARARALIATLNDEELEEADLQMAGGGREQGGHLETPDRSGDPARSVCDTCGRLDGSRPFAVAYHPANRDYLD